MTDTHASDRDPSHLRLLLGWLEVGLRRTTVDRLGLKRTPLKLLRFHDAPTAHATTWCTFEHSLRRWPGPDGLGVGYEVAWSARGPDIDGITALRRIVETLAALDRPPLPGQVLVDVFQGIDGLSPVLRHGVITPAWLWPTLEPLHDGNRRTELRLVVPAGEDEIDRIADDGFDGLEATWEQTAADLLDPARDPWTPD